jgi:hypothetical protein
LRSFEPLQERVARFRDRKVGIVGLGREGIDLARVLAGWGARVVVNDRADATSLTKSLERLSGLPVELILGRQNGDELLDCDEIYVRQSRRPARRARGCTPDGFGHPHVERDSPLL